MRDKYLQTQSQSSLANKTGQYYQLIRNSRRWRRRNHRFHRRPDSGGFSELSIRGGKYYDSSECKVLPNSRYGLVTCGPGTAGTGQQPEQYPADRVQGRDYTCKEYISGVTSVTISSRSPPNARTCIPRWEVSKFIRLFTIQGCHRLRQHGIAPVQHFTVDYTGLYLQPTDCRNVRIR